jgi:DNA replication protein DnaD
MKWYNFVTLRLGAWINMPEDYVVLEICRWGFAHLPGAVFYYGKELDLDIEDIGVITALFYAFEQTKPLYQSGVRAGQVILSCPTLNTQKLSRKLTLLSKLGLIELKDGESKNFTEKLIFLEPLMARLQQLVIRDHPMIIANKNAERTASEKLENYEQIIEQLELELEEEKSRRLQVENGNPRMVTHKTDSYKIVADFIAKKSGNLLSVKMESELQKWLDELGFTPEFLLCILELTFERSINNPREITRIARDLKEYSISTVEGLETYFTKYVDTNKNTNLRVNQFDPDIAEFGNYTGIDMNAEARKKVYYKWRYDWRFSHQMIMKAGEIMCQRTKNGGLEYIDSVLNNWMSKEIRSVNEAEKEILDFKTRNKNIKPIPLSGTGKAANLAGGRDYEMYVSPEVLEELKSKT